MSVKQRNIFITILDLIAFSAFYFLFGRAKTQNGELLPLPLMAVDIITRLITCMAFAAIISLLVSGAIFKSQPFKQRFRKIYPIGFFVVLIMMGSIYASTTKI